jgi:hypothetical protein
VLLMVSETPKWHKDLAKMGKKDSEFRKDGYPGFLLLHFQF